MSMPPDLVEAALCGLLACALANAWPSALALLGRAL